MRHPLTDGIDAADICFRTDTKSIVCEEDTYFKELVRYIHLNPLRAKLVDSLGRLDRYKWCGHAVVLGRLRNN